MAELRPFRGLRYTRAAEDLSALLAPPSIHLTPAERERYAARSPHNAVLLAAPEGDGDDRSKFVRYARAAARLAEWRRSGVLQAEDKPALYRLTQRFGADRIPRVTLLAVVGLEGLVEAESGDPRVKEERLRLLEATRTAFEPAVAFYDDPDGRILDAVRGAPASAEAGGDLDGGGIVLETVVDPDAIAALAAAFRDRSLSVADGVEGLQAARAFGASGALLALASMDDASYARLPVHRVVRRLPHDREATLARLATVFDIEDHHSRNLPIYLDQAAQGGKVAFGLATEGGFGYLLSPRTAIDEPAATWLSREVLGRLLGVGEADPTLTFTDPVQAIRAVNEGAAAAFIVPAARRDEIRDVQRTGVPLPSRSVQTYPAVPAGLAYWSIGDDA